LLAHTTNKSSVNFVVVLADNERKMFRRGHIKQVVRPGMGNLYTHGLDECWNIAGGLCIPKTACSCTYGKMISVFKMFSKILEGNCSSPGWQFPILVFLVKAVLNQNVLFYLPRQM